MSTKGLYRFTLEKFSLCTEVISEKHILSDSFTVGGHRLALAIFPGLYVNRGQHGGRVFYLDLCIKLLSECHNGVLCSFRITLLDQSSAGKHLTRSFPSTIVMPNQCTGYHHIIAIHSLDRLGYLLHDCLKIECEIEVHESAGGVARPVCDVGVNFLSMLDTDEGCDVTFNVMGRRFPAHSPVLRARSSVFASLLDDNLNHREMVVTSIEPRVFECLLHFIYSDSLPEDENRLLMDGYAFGLSVSATFGAKLLAAADKYDLKRLKSICEAHLWRTICFGRFSEILILAEQCNASELKKLCFKYASDNHVDLLELDNFKCLEKKCPLLLKELNNYILKHTSNK
ncbi:BTB/POZ and MATH domain-containing protein 6 [Striga hermonthica]|uniref:BTB/POZ and MATH domain-containing protein 6 n=1 Tax=Striga hermonthica TaxID=68872 RepID=A0A9N7N1I1_STRHE|nr:BTB/POZ and MATH domain-containing protein 6 [Striga hermonthica]